MRRRSVLVVVGALVPVLATTAAGWACTSTALLTLSPPKGPAGTQVSVVGAGFNVSAPVVPVVLRWNGADGPELARVVPDKAGGFTVAITVPAGTPGFYVVVAVQRDLLGVDRYGTPARASFEVRNPAVPPATTTPTTRPAATTPTTRARPATTSSSTTSTTVAPTTTTPSTTSTTAGPAPASVSAVVPVATRSDPLPAPAVAVSLALLLAVGVALARQARGR